MKKTIVFLLLVLGGMFQEESEKLPEDFVYINEKIPGIVYDIRYAGNKNFIGRQVIGYRAEQAILSKPAAEALSRVQEELIQQDYILKIFDAYRPQRAVNHFIKWARDEEDTLMKTEFYPQVSKSNLFQLGYIASKSGHSRGSTVDLTLVDANSCKEVDMGSTYDFFGEISHHETRQITEEQKKNRQLLKKVMQKYGFRPYPAEWWHYTYTPETYPDTYFDFPVE